MISGWLEVIGLALATWQIFSAAEERNGYKMVAWAGLIAWLLVF